MTDSSQGGGSGPDSTTQPAFKEYVVKRDSDGPLTFAGVQLAKASRETNGLGLIHVETLEAGVYRTRGGKFITSLSKTTRSGFASLAALGRSVEEEDAPDVRSNYRKAAVHQSFEDAVRWFKPGRLTDEIREQLGLDKPVRIE